MLELMELKPNVVEDSFKRQHIDWLPDSDCACNELGSHNSILISKKVSTLQKKKLNFLEITLEGSKSVTLLRHYSKSEYLL